MSRGTLIYLSDNDPMKINGTYTDAGFVKLCLDDPNNVAEEESHYKEYIFEPIMR